MLLLSTSHMTMHTWPEHGYAAVDIFHCSVDVASTDVVKDQRFLMRPTVVSSLIL